MLGAFKKVDKIDKVVFKDVKQINKYFFTSLDVNALTKHPKVWYST